MPLVYLFQGCGESKRDFIKMVEPFLKGFVWQDWSNGWESPVWKYPAKGKFLQVGHSMRQNYDSELCFLAVNSKRVDLEQSIKMKEGLV